MCVCSVPVPCHVLSCHALPRLATPCHACVVCLLCARALPRLVLPRLATPCHGVHCASRGLALSLELALLLVLLLSLVRHGLAQDCSAGYGLLNSYMATATARVMGNRGGNHISGDCPGSSGGGGATAVGNGANGRYCGARGGEGYTTNILHMTNQVYGSGGGGGSRGTCCYSTAVGGTGAGSAGYGNGGSAAVNKGGGGGGGGTPVPEVDLVAVVAVESWWLHTTRQILCPQLRLEALSRPTETGGVISLQPLALTHLRSSQRDIAMS